MASIAVALINSFIISVPLTISAGGITTPLIAHTRIILEEEALERKITQPALGEQDGLSFDTARPVMYRGISTNPARKLGPDFSVVLAETL